MPQGRCKNCNRLIYDTEKTDELPDRKECQHCHHINIIRPEPEPGPVAAASNPKDGFPNGLQTVTPTVPKPKTTTITKTITRTKAGEGTTADAVTPKEEW